MGAYHFGQPDDVCPESGTDPGPATERGLRIERGCESMAVHTLTRDDILDALSAAADTLLTRRDLGLPTGGTWLFIDGLLDQLNRMR